MAYAKIANSTVVQVLDHLDGVIHPALHDGYTEVISSVKEGMTTQDGQSFAWPETAAPDPVESVAPRVLPKLVFFQRLTTAERVGIRTAGKTDPVVEDWLAMLDLIENVHLDAEDVTASLGYFVSEGLIDANRVPEILA
ncbi:hypothetical protein [Phaeobacter inhibens]|uniref:hypothetical protein n=1 Tax=Phaeobacter inhibens TaxID=221822 RepID=UPI00249285B3|nr:hypothetical protein [Phaeobacter inhibens]